MSEQNDNVRDTAFAVAAYLHKLDPGPLAELRRMSDILGAPAFWRLHSRHGEIQKRPDEWLTITRILALLASKGSPENRPELHNGNRCLGTVLCDGGDPAWSDGRPRLSEARFARFLAARGEHRGAQLERIARMLSRSMVPGSGVDTGDIAWAILNPKAARRIASSYYGRLDRATTTQDNGAGT